MNSKEKIHQCEVVLERVQSERWPNLQQVSILKKELARAYYNEEEFWRQKSRKKWLRSGNRNSKFFHSSVKGNREYKRLEQLRDSNGVLKKTEAAKGEVASDCFNHLFKSSNPQSFNQWFSGFPARVSEEMNQSLIEKVSAEEIKEVVFSIDPSSAPGPDGMTGLFFQKYWEIVGPQVIKEIQIFFEEGVFPVEWNYTHLCLLPKILHPVEMSDLRPISLCSVLYKVILNILVKRLQPILPVIISSNQSAFVADRLITDNIMIAHEAVHSLKTYQDFSSQYMAIKTDMSKAYDRVEWSYVRALLSALGFHTRWINGLCSGDPLSPFLFVLCTEGLTYLLNKGQADGRLQGIKFSEEGPETHHLLFADDSLFMCKASVEQCSFLQESLGRYGAATGQVINLNKSSITFGSKVNPLLKTDIQALMGISREGGAGTYLGMPESFSGSKVEFLGYIKDRVKANLTGWYSRFLSQGGKEVLLKSVAMAMPVFVMSCFKLSKTICANLSSAMADFWWSNAEHTKGIHWLSWEKLCLPKEQGGMGFRDISTFNQALLAKQAWRILQFPDSLFAQVMKSRYFPENDFLSANLGPRPSYAWRSILHGRELLIQEMEKKVGNGKSIKVWIDEWIEDDGWRAPWRRNNFFNPDLRVSELLDLRSRDWDQEALEHHFLPGDIIRINKIKPVTSIEDFYSWKFNKSGEFSVKSAYWLASHSTNQHIRLEANQQPSTNALKAQVWKVHTDPKIKVFLWKLLSGALPVTAALKSKGMKVEDTCQICGAEEETINHVLFSCSLSRQIWALSGIPSPSSGLHKGSIFSNMHYLLSNQRNSLWPEELRKFFPWLIWRIWKNKNSVSFEGTSFSPLDTVQKCREDWMEWSEAQKRDNENGEESEVDGEGNQGIQRVHESLVGCSWALRDHNGVVLLHSRTAFVGVKDKLDAHFQRLIWAIECMRNHRVKKVIFAMQENCLVKALTNPNAWPSLRYQSMEVARSRGLFKDWKFFLKNLSSNRGAFMIAQSVTMEGRLQSYVAAGHPAWLDGVFAAERIIDPV
ncbi:PREDICTED: uncharacterized protein LOC104748579 [Camelina sativa]|uniref:Uncharacterized protein LOC104748579 n=1 Tax=Camelina sativa TaxID=90675 RepID=A0ABM0WB93_CAMSA|nr:PREDICTED: uncharacterized protein LOC104748579 [Camelina sativa]